MKHTNRKEFCMNFKKYNEMELALLSSIASMTKEEVESIEMEKGDYTPVTMEDYNSIPSYLTKPNAVRHAVRRKETFKKKVERKELAQNLGYSVGTEYNNNKVNDILSANHSDKSYFRGEKADKKYISIKEEVSMMEKENWEKARTAMMEEHSMILSSVMEDIDTLNMDLKSSMYFIENLKLEYKELEEAMKLVSEKLQNAYLRKNGIQAALLQKEEELDTLSANLKKGRISHFGW